MLTEYCSTCDILICSKCSNDKHASHKKENKEKAISSFQQQLKKDQKEIERQVNDIKGANLELTNFSKFLDQNYVETKETITQYFETIKKLADKKKDDLLKEINANYEKDSAIVKENLEKHEYLTKISTHVTKDQTSLVDTYDSIRYSKDILKVSSLNI